jgi:hypothetical protein
MEIRHDQQKPPDVSAGQCASNELIERIRKLRWMGMREEEEDVQRQVAQCRVRPADGVLATTPDTD